MNSYVRTRGGRMIHRRYGCPSGNPLHAATWTWADGMTLEVLADTLVATLGTDPQYEVCGHCFGRLERALWRNRTRRAAS